MGVPSSWRSRRFAATRTLWAVAMLAPAGCGDIFGSGDVINWPEELDNPRLVITALDQHSEPVTGVQYELIEPGGASLGVAFTDQSGRAVYAPFGILTGTYNLVIRSVPEGYGIAEGQLNPVPFVWRTGAPGETVADRSVTTLLTRES